MQGLRGSRRGGSGAARETHAAGHPVDGPHQLGEAGPEAGSGPAQLAYRLGQFGQPGAGNFERGVRTRRVGHGMGSGCRPHHAGVVREWSLGAGWSNRASAESGSDEEFYSD